VSLNFKGWQYGFGLGKKRMSMSKIGVSDPGKQQVSSTRKNLKRFFKTIILFVFLGSLLFLTSGQLDWVMAWIFLIVFIAGLFVTSTLLGSNREELLQERHNVPEDAKNWDQVLSNLFSYLTLFVTLPIAGLDKRFGWTQDINLTLQLVSFIFALAGYSLIIWAMVSNRFFSRIVRVQKERGHSVVSSGPYRFVRHPGYVGMLLFALATPLTLGSLWALISGGVAALVILLRTALEDRTLLEELEGYKEYSKQVRSRLIPGVW
jgi:protein-S-isoprenylcysteine O-methyltransferase Ste14